MGRLRKVHVTPGVAWVEAPEAGLSVLCGCPADVVKHLMRHGLIVQTECDGRTVETGPNAILLSDIMVQNGAFCNLAEFPVLQMLYRQGMMVPGHPNNVGNKPLLIGSAAQVEAQLHYIHRGNYGLVSRAELLATGMTPRMADEILAYKRKFAFGHIRPPSDLLDSVILGDAPTALPGGVTLRRLAMNVFQFCLGDEAVIVDLNLSPGQVYQPPYSLGCHRVEREYFSVVHCGDGNGWDPDRPAMGSVLMFQGRVYLIDAGPNVQYTLNALGIGVNEVEGLFHTHCHDDHFAGLTTLLRADRRIRYFTTPLVRASVMKKLAALLAVDEAMFTDYFDVHDLAFDRWNDVNGLDVLPLLSPHPVETSIFLFRAVWENGYRSYAHLADIASREVLQSMVEKPGVPGVSQGFIDKVTADYEVPADVKKVDIGGGMIHGCASDFREDESTKVILSHLERPLTTAEREIGSGAPFGTADVIIHGNQDYASRCAFEHLRTYFPDVPHHALTVLLNCPMLVCNPETILLRQDMPVTHVFLTISGTVERIAAGSPISGVLSAGSLIGEVAAILGDPASITYRAASFVQALRIPVKLYGEFIRRNGLLQDLLALAERRAFLRSTWVCGESLSETTLTRLAKAMVSANFAAGETVDPAGRLGLVRTGVVGLMAGDDAVERLGRGDVFGEDVAMFCRAGPFRLRADKDVAAYLIPAELVQSVPVIRWKLLEGQSRRLYAGIVSFPRGGRQTDEPAEPARRLSI